MKQLFKLLIEADKEENKIALTAEADIDKLKRYVMPLLMSGFLNKAVQNAVIPAATEKSELEYKLLEYLAKNPYVSGAPGIYFDKAAKDLGVTMDQILAARKSLVDKGLIQVQEDEKKQQP